MSYITLERSNMLVDCPECNFSVLIGHDHDGDHKLHCNAPGEDLEEKFHYSRSK